MGPNNKDDDNFKAVGKLDPQSLIEMLEIASNLKRILSKNAEIAEKEVERRIPMLMILFEYLASNIDNPNIDQTLLSFLEDFLGLSATREKQFQREEEEELEEEVELDEKEKAHRLRMAIYEVYKILNPNQLAGETALDNFINNVKTRGIREAMKYSGSEYVDKFRASDLENLESHGFAMREAPAILEPKVAAAGFD